MEGTLLALHISGEQQVALMLYVIPESKVGFPPVMHNSPSEHKSWLNTK